MPARLVAAAAVSSVLIAVVGVAGAATGPSLSLRLPGVHAKSVARCGDAHADPYSAVARGVRLTIVGTVKPAPKRTNWQARFSIKHCVNRTYRQVWTGKVMGHRTGLFRIPYTPRLGGLYVVVADYGKHPNVSSPKLRLRAR